MTGNGEIKQLPITAVKKDKHKPINEARHINRNMKTKNDNCCFIHKPEHHTAFSGAKYA